jgi:hypothetical protein
MDSAVEYSSFPEELEKVEQNDEKNFKSLLEAKWLYIFFMLLTITALALSIVALTKEDEKITDDVTITSNGLLSAKGFTDEYAENAVSVESFPFLAQNGVVQATSYTGNSFVTNAGVDQAILNGDGLMMSAGATKFNIRVNGVETPADYDETKLTVGQIPVTLATMIPSSATHLPTAYTVPPFTIPAKTFHKQGDSLLVKIKLHGPTANTVTISGSTISDGTDTLTLGDYAHGPTSDSDTSLVEYNIEYVNSTDQHILVSSYSSNMSKLSNDILTNLDLTQDLLFSLILNSASNSILVSIEIIYKPSGPVVTPIVIA